MRISRSRESVREHRCSVQALSFAKLIALQKGSARQPWYRADRPDTHPNSSRELFREAEAGCQAAPPRA
jgi:hypothetical protein